MEGENYIFSISNISTKNLNSHMSNSNSITEETSEKVASFRVGEALKLPKIEPFNIFEINPQASIRKKVSIFTTRPICSYNRISTSQKLTKGSFKFFLPSSNKLERNISQNCATVSTYTINFKPNSSYLQSKISRTRSLPFTKSVSRNELINHISFPPSVYASSPSHLNMNTVRSSIYNSHIQVTSFNDRLKFTNLPPKSEPSYSDLIYKSKRVPTNSIGTNCKSPLLNFHFKRNKDRDLRFIEMIKGNLNKAQIDESRNKAMVDVSQKSSKHYISSVHKINLKKDSKFDSLNCKLSSDTRAKNKLNVKSIPESTHNFTQVLSTLERDSPCFSKNLIYKLSKPNSSNLSISLASTKGSHKECSPRKYVYLNSALGFDENTPYNTLSTISTIPDSTNERHLLDVELRTSFGHPIIHSDNNTNLEKTCLSQERYDSNKCTYNSFTQLHPNTTPLNTFEQNSHEPKKASCELYLSEKAKCNSCLPNENPNQNKVTSSLEYEMDHKNIYKGTKQENSGNLTTNPDQDGKIKIIQKYSGRDDKNSSCHFYIALNNSPHDPIPSPKFASSKDTIDTSDIKLPMTLLEDCDNTSQHFTNQNPSKALSDHFQSINTSPTHFLIEENSSSNISNKFRKELPNISLLFSLEGKEIKLDEPLISCTTDAQSPTDSIQSATISEKLVSSFQSQKLETPPFNVSEQSSKPHESEKLSSISAIQLSGNDIQSQIFNSNKDSQTKSTVNDYLTNPKPDSSPSDGIIDIETNKDMKNEALISYPRHCKQENYNLNGFQNNPNNFTLNKDNIEVKQQNFKIPPSLSSSNQVIKSVQSNSDHTQSLKSEKTISKHPSTSEPLIAHVYTPLEQQVIPLQSQTPIHDNYIASNYPASEAYGQLEMNDTSGIPLFKCNHITSKFGDNNSYNSGFQSNRIQSILHCTSVNPELIGNNSLLNTTSFHFIKSASNRQEVNSVPVPSGLLYQIQGQIDHSRPLYNPYVSGSNSYTSIVYPSYYYSQYQQREFHHEPKFPLTPLQTQPHNTSINNSSTSNPYIITKYNSIQHSHNIEYPFVLSCADNIDFLYNAPRYDAHSLNFNYIYPPFNYYFNISSNLNFGEDFTNRINSYHSFPPQIQQLNSINPQKPSKYQSCINSDVLNHFNSILKSFSQLSKTQYEMMYLSEEYKD